MDTQNLAPKFKRGDKVALVVSEPQHRGVVIDHDEVNNLYVVDFPMREHETYCEEFDLARVPEVGARIRLTVPPEVPGLDTVPADEIGTVTVTGPRYVEVCFPSWKGTAFLKYGEFEEAP